VWGLHAFLSGRLAAPHLSDYKKIIPTVEESCCGQK
jgi:hypothetical protein